MKKQIVLLIFICVFATAQEYQPLTTDSLLKKYEAEYKHVTDTILLSFAHSLKQPV